MKVYDAIRTVLAVREFQDKPVPEALVEKNVEAADLRQAVKMANLGTLSSSMIGLRYVN